MNNMGTSNPDRSNTPSSKEPTLFEGVTEINKMCNDILDLTNAIDSKMFPQMPTNDCDLKAVTDGSMSTIIKNIFSTVYEAKHNLEIINSKIGNLQ